MSTGSRRDFLALAALTGFAGLAVSGCAGTSRVHGQHGLTEDLTNLTPDQALAKLKEGNQRFVEMAEIAPNVSTTRLVAVSAGQKPFVGVLGCVDSRVPPELVFDRGLGDVFDARIAGAIPDDAAIGSLEFGVDEFGVPLLVVLGHTRCGAITAAAKAVDSATTAEPGRIGAVVDLIIPVVKAVKARGVTGDAVVNTAAQDVVRRSVAALQSSPVLKDRLASGKLKVAGAFYDLDSGKVEFLS